MLVINWEFIPLILLAIAALCTFVLNGFSFSPRLESTPGMLSGIFMVFLIYVNIAFYGIWGLYWVVCHIKIV